MASMPGVGEVAIRVVDELPDVPPVSLSQASQAAWMMVNNYGDEFVMPKIMGEVSTSPCSYQLLLVMPDQQKVRND